MVTSGQRGELPANQRRSDAAVDMIASELATLLAHVGDVCCAHTLPTLEVSVSVTQIDLDDEVLADVMRLAGVHTKKEAVNLAMRDYVDRFRRIEALARSREQAKTWDYEGWLAARADEKAVGT